MRDHESSSRLKFWRRTLHTSAGCRGYRELHSGPATVAGNAGPDPGAGAGNLGCRGESAGAAANRISAAVCGRHGPSRNRRSHGDEGRDGKGTPLSGAPIGARQAGGNKMSKHLSEQGVSMYLIGDVSLEERQHAADCAACQAKIAESRHIALAFSRSGPELERSGECEGSRGGTPLDGDSGLGSSGAHAAAGVAGYAVVSLAVEQHPRSFAAADSAAGRDFQTGPGEQTSGVSTGRQKKSWVMSVALQSAVVLLLFTAASDRTVQQKVAHFIPLLDPNLAAYEPKQAHAAGHDGGWRRRRRPFAAAGFEGPPSEGRPEAVHAADGGGSKYWTRSSRWSRASSRRRTSGFRT